MARIGIAPGYGVQEIEVGSGLEVTDALSANPTLSTIGPIVYRSPLVDCYAPAGTLVTFFVPTVDVIPVALYTRLVTTDVDTDGAFRATAGTNGPTYDNLATGSVTFEFSTIVGNTISPFLLDPFSGSTLLVAGVPVVIITTIAETGGLVETGYFYCVAIRG